MRRISFWLAAVTALALLAVVGIAVGAVPLDVRDVARALLGQGDETTISIVRALRLPRVALAALVGAGLGASGASLQGVLRNPLAEPYLLGVSGGAAVGAVIAVTSGLASVGMVPLAAFAGALAAVLLVLVVAVAAGGRADPRILLMAGVVIGAFSNAVIFLLLAGAPAERTQGALWWMMGSVAGASWPAVAWLALYLACGIAFLLYWAGDVDALALGEDAAASLGVDVERASRRVYVVSSLVAAATVAAAGLVGFVGLIVPNLARGVAGRGHRATIGGSAIAGAALLVGADVVARTIRAPIELPLGAVTALVGVPFFLVRLGRWR